MGPNVFFCRSFRSESNEIGTHPTPPLTEYAVLLALVHAAKGGKRGVENKIGMVSTMLPNTKTEN
jgi:hypothetical protein